MLLRRNKSFHEFNRRIDPYDKRVCYIKAVANQHICRCSSGCVNFCVFTFLLHIPLRGGLTRAWNPQAQAQPKGELAFKPQAPSSSPKPKPQARLMSSKKQKLGSKLKNLCQKALKSANQHDQWSPNRQVYIIISSKIVRATQPIWSWSPQAQAQLKTQLKTGLESTRSLLSPWQVVDLTPLCPQRHHFFQFPTQKDGPFPRLQYWFKLLETSIIIFNSCAITIRLKI